MHPNQKTAHDRKVTPPKFSCRLLLAMSTVSILILGLPAYRFTVSDLDDQLQNYQNSIYDMQQLIIASTQEEYQYNVSQQIKTIIETSVHPGEAVQFPEIEQQCGSIKGLKACFFYGDDGAILGSLNDTDTEPTIEADVWEECRQTRNTVFRHERDKTVSIYEPLVVDADMVRFNPSQSLGKIYGILRFKVSRDDAKYSAMLGTMTAQTATQGKNAYLAALFRAFRVNMAISLGGLLLIASAFVFSLRKGTLKADYYEGQE